MARSKDVGYFEVGSSDFSPGANSTIISASWESWPMLGCCATCLSIRPLIKNTQSLQSIERVWARGV